MLSTRPPLLALLLGIAVTASACGGDDEKAAPVKSDTVATNPSSGRDTGTGDEEAAKPADGDGEEKRPKRPTHAGLFRAEVSAADARRIGGSYGRRGRWTLILGKASYNISSTSKLLSGTLDVSGRRMTYAGIAKARVPQVQMSCERKFSSKLPAEQRKKLERAFREACRKRGNQPTATDLAGPCGRAKGRYRWSIQGGELTLEPVEDPCKSRRILLSRSWTRGR